MVSALDLVTHFNRNSQEAGATIAAYEALVAQVRETQARVDAQLAQAKFELGAAYLPALAGPVITRAEGLTGFRGFSRRDPNTAMEQERSVLQRTVARIEADPLWQEREMLAGPHGTRATALAEAKEMLEPWQQECARFERHPGFNELVAIGYDTPSFQSKWWEKQYWSQWAKGDAICEALGMDDFGDDVLPAWIKADKQREFWLAEVNRLNAELDEVHELVRTRDASEARVPQLPQIYLRQAQEVLGEHLALADLPLLDEWLEREASVDRAVKMGLRRLAGMQAKIRLLGELEREGLTPLIAQLEKRRSKYARKRQKYGRSKYIRTNFPQSAMDQKFPAKAQKLRERHEKLSRLLGKIDAYDKFARFDLENAEDLWWKEITGSRPPRIMPSTRRWYEANPQVALRRERDEGLGSHVAQALVVSEDEEVYLS